MDKPNVILLTIDTLRADRVNARTKRDRVGAFDYGRTLTPTLDRMAAQGVRFTNAISGGSWTQAAFPTMFTSTYASMFGGCVGPLAHDRPSPVQTFADSGYQTGGFSTSPLLSRTYGYDRGFEHFVDLLPHEADPLLRKIKGGQNLLRASVTHQIAALAGKNLRPGRLYVSAADVTDNLLGWLDTTEKPFFAWAHYMDVHWPYHREETLTHPQEIAQAWQDLGHMHRVNAKRESISPSQRSRLVELYEDAVQYVDSQIGRLLQQIEQSRYGANTIVVVISDHGEEFLEHGRWGHWENNLRDEILKIPFIIYHSGTAIRRTVGRQVRTIDLMPTLLDLCGLPGDDRLMGVSLVPLWQEDAVAPLSSSGATKAAPLMNIGVTKTANFDTVSISEMWRDEWHIIAVRTDSFKYMWDSRNENHPQLYDLSEDKAELRDVSMYHPDVVEEYHKYVQDTLMRAEQTQPIEAVMEPDLDTPVKARLRDLGYLA